MKTLRLYYRVILVVISLTISLQLNSSCIRQEKKVDYELVATGEESAQLYDGIFGDEGSHFRSSALQEIRDHRDSPLYLEVLRRGLHDSAPFNVIYANWGLFLIRDDPNERLRFLLDKTCVPGTDDADYAAWVLRYFLPSTKDNTYGPIVFDGPDLPLRRDTDDAYVPTILEYLASSNLCSKEIALKTLRYCCSLPGVGDALLDTARNGSAEEKGWVVNTLETITAGSLVPQTADIQCTLFCLAAGNDPQLREIAAISARGLAATDMLVSMLQTLTGDTDENTRAASVYSLCVIATPEEAVPVAITALSDSSEEVVKQAIWGLGTIGPAASEALPKLREIANARDPSSLGYHPSGFTGRAIDLIEGKETIREDIPPDDYWIYYPLITRGT
jgi:hypothetical protein